MPFGLSTTNNFTSGAPTATGSRVRILAKYEKRPEITTSGGKSEWLGLSTEDNFTSGASTATGSGVCG